MSVYVCERESVRLSRCQHFHRFSFSFSISSPSLSHPSDHFHTCPRSRGHGGDLTLRPPQETPTITAPPSLCHSPPQRTMASASHPACPLAAVPAVVLAEEGRNGNGKTPAVKGKAGAKKWCKLLFLTSSENISLKPVCV